MNCNIFFFWFVNYLLTLLKVYIQGTSRKGPAVVNIMRPECAQHWYNPAAKETGLYAQAWTMTTSLY